MKLFNFGKKRDEVVKMAEARPPQGERMPTPTGELLSQKFGLLLNNIGPFNPDKLVTEGGAGDDAGERGYAIYRKMLSDEMVQSCIRLKLGAVAKQSWSITPPKGVDPDLERIEFLTDQITKLRLNHIVRRIGQSLTFGFAVNEKVFGLRDGLVTLEKLKYKEPDSIDFDLDEFLNIKQLKYFPSLGVSAQYNVDDPKLFPVDKFVISTWNQQGEEPWGRSDLRQAYRPWYTKNFTQMSELIFVEVFGLPLKAAFYEEGTDEATIQSAQTMLEQIQTNFGAVLPKSFELALEQVNAANAPHDVVINRCDAQIARSILFQNLTTSGSDQGSGSYALGRVHYNVMELAIEELMTLVEDGVSEVLDDLSRYNWGEEGYRLSFDEMSREAIAELVSVGQFLSGLSVEDKQPLFDWIDENFGVRLEPKEQQDMPFPMPGFGAEPGGGDDNRAENAEDGEGQVSPEDAEESAIEKLAEPPIIEPVTPARKSKPQPVEKLFTQVEDKFNIPVANGYGEVFRSIRDWARANEGVFTASPEKQMKAAGQFTKMVQRNAGKVQEPLYAALLAMNLLSRVDAQAQTGKYVDVKKKEMLAEPNPEGKGSLQGFQQAVDARGVTAELLMVDPLPRAVEKLFKGKVVLSSAEYGKLAATLKRRAFTVAGSDTDALAAEMKKLLDVVMDRGGGVRDFLSMVDKQELKYTTSPKLWAKQAGGRAIPAVAGDKVLGYHARTVFRNSVTNTFNDARMSVFRDPAVIESFPALQFIAVDDADTTDICRSRDGVIRPVNDPWWDTNTPPLHHNCRSIVRSVSRSELEGMDMPLGDPLPESVLKNPVQDGFGALPKEPK